MKKRIITIISAILLVLCFVPLRFQSKDGTTNSLVAVLYSATGYNVPLKNEYGTDYFRTDIAENAAGHLTGIEIKLLGFTIYDDVAFEADN